MYDLLTVVNAAHFPSVSMTESIWRKIVKEYECMEIMKHVSECISMMVTRADGVQLQA